MHIVHSDIKPDNIQFSPSLSQPVFIDFGLSDMLREQSGETTLTRFKGTLGFMCPQLSEMHNSFSQSRVDLYYNDTYGLGKTLAHFARMEKKPGNFCTEFDNSLGE